MLTNSEITQMKDTKEKTKHLEDLLNTDYLPFTVTETTMFWDSFEMGLLNITLNSMLTAEASAFLVRRDFHYRGIDCAVIWFVLCEQDT